VSTAIEIRISHRMLREDMTKLRFWLGSEYPGDWELRAGRDKGLGVGDDILIGLCSGIGAAAVDQVRDTVVTMLEKVVERYQRDKKPEYQVAVSDEPEKDAEDTLEQR
jgi:hypothetical protein